MEPKLFTKSLRSRYSGKVSELSYFGLTWNQWSKFAKMTRDLDYGCNFNTDKKACKKRICTGKNLYGSSAQALQKNEMCCCSNCRSHIGYLKLIPNSEEAIKEIASLFDEKYGFWRDKIGCILPIQYRSNTCVSYRCPEARRYRDNLKEYSYGSDFLEQMILYFLDTTRSDKLSATQIRTIIKELIKMSSIKGMF